MESITEQLRTTFELASLRNKVDRFRKPDDVDRGLEIINRYKNKLDNLEQNYRIEYESRVSLVTKKLIDKAGTKKLSFKHRLLGGDGFNKATLNRQAQRIVRNKHQQTVDNLNRQELLELNTLREEIDQRDQLQGRPSRDFERNATRRSGIDRRSPTRNR